MGEISDYWLGGWANSKMPKIGKPKRDKSKSKAQREARKRNR